MSCKGPIAMEDRGGNARIVKPEARFMKLEEKRCGDPARKTRLFAGLLLSYFRAPVDIFLTTHRESIRYAVTVSPR